MDALSIRIAEKDDIDAIAELAGKIFESPKISMSDDNIYFVAEKNGKLIGFCHLVEKEGKIILQGVGVDPNERGRGAGTKLLNEAVDYCEKKGLEVVLKVKADNPACRLYAKSGFVPKKSGEVFTLARKKPT